MGTSACPLCCLSVGQPWRNRFAAFGLAGTSRLFGHARPQLAKPPRLSAGTRRLYVFLVQRRGNGPLPVPYMQREQAPAKLERLASRWFECYLDEDNKLRPNRFASSAVSHRSAARACVDRPGGSAGVMVYRRLFFRASCAT
jgi:hypothetical protein